MQSRTCFFWILVLECFIFFAVPDGTFLCFLKWTGHILALCEEYTEIAAASAGPLSPLSPHCTLPHSCLHHPQVCFLKQWQQPELSPPTTFLLQVPVVSMESTTEPLQGQWTASNCQLLQVLFCSLREMGMQRPCHLSLGKDKSWWQHVPQRASCRAGPSPSCTVLPGPTISTSFHRFWCLSYSQWDTSHPDMASASP